VTGLGSPCPFGKRRDSKGSCSKCIPGMKESSDCREYRYSKQRKVKLSDDQSAISNSSGSADRHVQLLVASWLMEQTRNTQHVFEWGISSTRQSISEHLVAGCQSILQSVVSVDPRISRPRWTDPWEISDLGQTTTLRWLPCLVSDVLSARGRYRSLVDLSSVDTVVCWQCDDRVLRAGSSSTSAAEIFAMFLREDVPLIRTLVLEGTAATEESTAVGGSLVELVAVLEEDSWAREADLVLGTGSSGHDTAAASPPPRQLILLTRKLGKISAL